MTALFLLVSDQNPGGPRIGEVISGLRGRRLWTLAL